MGIMAEIRTKLIVLAALGTHRNTHHAAKIIENFSNEWDCMILTYSRNVNVSLFSDRCRIMYKPAHWGTLVRYATSQTLSYENVALVLDDVRNVDHVDPDGLCRTMDAHNASIISPGVRLSHHMHHLRENCLHQVQFVELFYVIFKRFAWACLHRMLDEFPSSTSISGWGLDFCFYHRCNAVMLYDNRVHVVHGRRLNPYSDIAFIENMTRNRSNATCFNKKYKGTSRCVG